MSHIPSDLHYTKTHAWIKLENEDIIKIGLTEHMLEKLGNILCVELPEIDQHFYTDDDIAVIETAKTAYDIYSPVCGKIIEINESLVDEPDIINEDPYGEGWLIKIQISNDKGMESLLDASSYAESIE